MYSNRTITPYSNQKAVTNLHFQFTFFKKTKNTIPKTTMIIIYNFQRGVMEHNYPIGPGFPKCVPNKHLLITKLCKPCYISILIFSKKQVILKALSIPVVNKSQELWLTQCFHPFTSYNPSNKDMQIVYSTCKATL